MTKAQSFFRDTHLPEYLMEAAGLGIFMISAGFFTVLFEYPGSPLNTLIADPFIRRALIGVAMGLTAVGLIYSPWGKQSGAHYNPAVTLSFYRLKKVSLIDSLFYILFQTLGGTAGVLISSLLFHSMYTGSPVQYVVTKPGHSGIISAFVAELIISFILMLSVLFLSNKPKFARYTGIGAGILLFLFISFESPYSGMSINPARSFSSAFPSQIWDSFWIYLTAPLLGMLGATEIYIRLKKNHRVICAKLNHHNHLRCIFLDCGYKQFDSDSLNNLKYDNHGN